MVGVAFLLPTLGFCLAFGEMLLYYSLDLIPLDLYRISLPLLGNMIPDGTNILKQTNPPGALNTLRGVDISGINNVSELGEPLAHRLDSLESEGQDGAGRYAQQRLHHVRGYTRRRAEH